MLLTMAINFAKHYPSLDQQAFINDAVYKLETHELKERSNQIMLAMPKHLPNDLALCAPIILNSLSPVKEQDDVLFSPDFDREQVQQGIRGWPIMPIADYIKTVMTIFIKRVV
jgi:hypothetical protein